MMAAFWFGTAVAFQLEYLGSFPVTGRGLGRWDQV
jgi:hypothetical protein